MLSYWINFQLSEWEPFTYHALTVALHCFNSVLVFMLFLRILRLPDLNQDRSPQKSPGRVLIAAGLASALFLVHPIQTESVAYVAGRSEVLCGVFVLTSLVLFLSPAPLTWFRSILIVFSYGCAVLSKEQAAVLPALFVAIDIFLRGRTIRQSFYEGRRLYGLLLAAFVVAVAAVVAVITRSPTAGLRVSGMHWYEYLFSQFRIWFLYLRLTVFPLHQTADYDLPLSHSILEHGSALALAALLLIAGFAWRLRDRYPLTFLGLLMFAVLLAPTSSFIPIHDLAAERRMYMPLVGLLLIAAETLLHAELNERLTAATVAVLLIFAALTYERSIIWGSDVEFWRDNVARSPAKARGYTHLLYAYLRTGRCREAVATSGSVPALVKQTPEFLSVLGNAYACSHRPEEAVKAFEQAARIGPSVGRYLTLAAIYRQVGRTEEGQAAEQQALKLAPKSSFDNSALEQWRRSGEANRSRTAGPIAFP